MKRQAFKVSYIAIMLAFLVIFLLFTGGIQTVSAATSSYTLALDDLFKDDNFNPEEYPEKPKDYSLNVIQIAESTDGELLIYVYQPSGQKVQLTATTIRFSTVRNEDYDDPDARWDDYKLTYLNSVGVFFKYKVKGFSVLKSETRYYNVAAIHRKWYSAIDSAVSGQIVSEVVFPVKALWKAINEDGEVTYEKYESEAVTITDKRVGLIRAGNGIGFFKNTACDDHFVAFSCDRRIDELYDADVKFRTRTYSNNLYETTYGDYSPEKTVTISTLDAGANPGGGLGAVSYSWKCIQTPEELITSFTAAGGSFSAEQQAELLSYQYVLHFLATEYTSNISFGTANIIGGIMALCGSELSSGTDVADVTILRLHFQSEGKTYNLGVVDNKQTNPTPQMPGIGGGNGSGSGCNGCNSELPWWGWVLIFTLGPLALILLYVSVFLIISAITRRSRERRRIMREAAWAQEAQDKAAEKAAKAEKKKKSEESKGKTVTQAQSGKKKVGKK